MTFVKQVITIKDNNNKPKDKYLIGSASLGIFRSR